MRLLLFVNQTRLVAVCLLLSMWSLIVSCII